MRIIVSGSRDFTDYTFFKNLLDSFLKTLPVEKSEITFLHGDCRGTDKMAELYAKQNNCACIAFPADWEKYGQSAGPIRNNQMLNEGVDYLVAFTTNRSRGTKDIIAKAAKKRH